MRFGITEIARLLISENESIKQTTLTAFLLQGLCLCAAVS